MSCELRFDIGIWQILLSKKCIILYKQIVELMAVKSFALWPIKSKQVLQCRIFALGASLAQDRGRLEAKIEVLTTELESQKKQNQRDNDSLKIKTKIVDDQTETIRKLKEVNIHF